MKLQNYKAFIGGMLFASLLIISFSFYPKAKSESPDPANHLKIERTIPISPETAQIYRNNYNRLNQGNVTAINFSVEQWQAVNQTVNERGGNLDNVSGFRLYFGNKNSEPGSELVSIVYLLNSQLQEQLPGLMLNAAEGFNAAYNQQCPPFCD